MVSQTTYIPSYCHVACCRCGEGYYNSYKDEEKLLCSACHKSCQSHCNGSGPKACAKCAQGYQRDTEHGCTDLDECLVSREGEEDPFCGISLAPPSLFKPF